MKFAVIQSNFVTNLIVAREDQQTELETSLGARLENAAPLGLEIGDYFNGANWTRNVSGEQVALPLGDNLEAAQILDLLESGE